MEPKYRLDIVNGNISGFIFDEFGEYNLEQAQNCVLCNKLDPTPEEVQNKRDENANLEKLNLYKKLRSIEYPKITEYIDGVVKGDQEQIQAYIDACLAVKAKYPKPEGN